jgi:hypothetical protein
MTIYVFELELLTLTEICDWLIALLDPIAVSVAYTVKGKAIPLQAWTGPEGSRSLRLAEFKTVGT